MAPSLLGTLESALYTSDLDAAEAFWVGVMGLEVITRQPSRHVFFRTSMTPYPQVLLVFDPSATTEPPAANARFPVPPHGATGAGHVCFAVPAEALDEWRRHLESNGVEIEADFHWPNGARSIYFRDPADNSIELADPSIWAVPDDHRRP